MVHGARLCKQQGRIQEFFHGGGAFFLSMDGVLSQQLFWAQNCPKIINFTDEEGG